MRILYGLAAICLLMGTFSCAKENLVPAKKAPENVISQAAFTEYIIPKGDQYCKRMIYHLVELDSLSFSVKFDSSAIYKSSDPADQADINKLYGFSDNNTGHHLYSARFGWRWYNNELEIFAYDYNNGLRHWKKLGVVSIGTIAKCCIRIARDKYIFNLNGVSTYLPRESHTLKGEGYMLYPYFGGNEPAPHEIRIWIKKLQPAD